MKIFLRCFGAIAILICNYFLWGVLWGNFGSTYSIVIVTVTLLFGYFFSSLFFYRKVNYHKKISFYITIVVYFILVSVHFNWIENQFTGNV
ncbi:hypothetical protein CN918_25960 [Priestia megaterium]|nr:hypothetical protein CN918_25960 [Priestia megaterium]